MLRMGPENEDVAEGCGCFQWSLDFVGLVLAGASTSDENAQLPYGSSRGRMPFYVVSAVRMGCINKIGRLRSSKPLCLRKSTSLFL